MKKKTNLIGRYEVLEVLGVGGMGIVYRCFDPEIKRIVAVKVQIVDKKRKSSFDSHKMRFIREALSTAQLQHPYIPPVYDVALDPDGQIYYVMKLIEGKSLESIIKNLREENSSFNEEFDIFRLIEILRDVCQATHYAHSKGYIHRDLKPSNIFVGNYGEVYVIDWGLTKIFKSSEINFKTKKKAASKTPDNLNLEAGSENQEILKTQIMENGFVTENFSPDDFIHTVPLEDGTHTVPLGDTVIAPDGNIDTEQTLTLKGNILGTIYYMSPEQALGNADKLGPEVDIYSLGVILYEMLSLELPVEGKDFKEVLARKVKKDIESPELRITSREIPPELSAITMQAMNPNPDERFKSAKEFNNALEFWLEGKSQYRRVTSTTLDISDLNAIPRETSRAWQIQKNNIITQTLKREDNLYLLFKQEFIGDVKFSLNFIAYPLEQGTDKISEFALILNATIPIPYQGFLDAYTVHFGASRNTRTFITKNDVEVLSNEYIILEPGKRYNLTIENSGNKIRVLLNRQLVLLYYDNTPFSGLNFGFLHKGENIYYSDIKIQSRGLPGKVSALDVPEALMVEECYEGAMKRFLAISHGNLNRHGGAWACYRAGIASYLLDGDRKKALKIWKQLLDGPYAIYEKLGRCSLELENNRPLKATAIIQSILNRKIPVPHLDPFADIIFLEAQHCLRKKIVKEKDWIIIDAWCRLALKMGHIMKNKQSMTPSILWRWMLLAIAYRPERLPESILFLRKLFGKGQGAFAEILTTIDPLMTILLRTAKMKDHAFLMDKVMRLILNYDDNLGNLETLVRFYINSGHVDVAEKISKHINQLCKKHNREIPPAPLAFITCLAWIRNEKNSRKLIHLMIDKSYDWGRPDGQILLGLDHYRKGETQEAYLCWEGLVENSEAISYNRHLLARALLGELPSDPSKAGVPNRSDHQLLYCLFLGFKFYIDWETKKDENSRAVSVKLLEKVLSLMRASYDIYSATDIFPRLILEKMGSLKHPEVKPDPLTKEEEKWLEKLTSAASQRSPDKNRRRSSSRKKIAG
jgi:serine/threonine protein kinase